MESLPDYYSILGVSRIASQRSIKRAYRIAALRDHPDNCPEGGEEAHRRFSLVVEAYRTLSDSDRRRRYDFRWQQYAALMGERRFQPDRQEPAEGRIWWDDRKGPGFYHRVERNRDEVRILVLACLAGMALAGTVLLHLLGRAGGSSPAGLLPGSLLLRTLVAQGIYLAVVGATVGAILLTRYTVRKILQLRYAAQLAGKSEVLPPSDRQEPS
jgi:hypothetical protein